MNKNNNHNGDYNNNTGLIVFAIIGIIVIIVILFIIYKNTKDLFSSKLYYIAGIGFILLGVLLGIINIIYDLNSATSNIAYAFRDAAHWILLLGAVLVAIAIYHMHVERFSWERNIRPYNR